MERKEYTRTVKLCRSTSACFYKESEDDKMLEILLIVVIYVLFKLPEWKFDNYMPPEGQRIDYNKQSYDRIVNNLSNEQVMKNTMNGKYNVKR